MALPVAPGSHRPRPSSSAGILNGGMEPLSTSPLHPPSFSSSPLSLSPIESPLAIGSFLEQRARELFRPTNHSDTGEEEEAEQQEEEAQDEETKPPGQEVEEAILLAGSPQMESPSWGPAAGPTAPEAPDLTLAVRQRRRELRIMDYDESLPEY